MITNCIKQETPPYVLKNKPNSNLIFVNDLDLSSVIFQDRIFCEPGGVPVICGGGRRKHAGALPTLAKDEPDEDWLDTLLVHQVLPQPK